MSTEIYYFSGTGNSLYVAKATRAGSIFRGFKKMEQLLQKKRKKLDSHFILNMYNNESRHEGYKVPTESDILSLEKTV